MTVKTTTTTTITITCDRCGVHVTVDPTVGMEPLSYKRNEAGWRELLSPNHEKTDLCRACNGEFKAFMSMQEDES